MLRSKEEIVKDNVREKWKRCSIEKLKELKERHEVTVLSAFKEHAFSSCDLCNYITVRTSEKDKNSCYFCPAFSDEICRKSLDRAKEDDYLIGKMANSLEEDEFDRYEELREELLEWINDVSVKVLEEARED